LYLRAQDKTHKHFASCHLAVSQKGVDMNIEMIEVADLTVINEKEFEALEHLSNDFELAFNALPDNIKLAYFNWVVGRQS
jgi:hypothetical protein